MNDLFLLYVWVSKSLQIVAPIRQMSKKEEEEEGGRWVKENSERTDELEGVRRSEAVNV